MILLLLILIVVLLLIFGGGTYVTRRDPAYYTGPSINWLLIAIVLLFVWFLYEQGVFGR